MKDATDKKASQHGGLYESDQAIDFKEILRTLQNRIVVDLADSWVAVAEHVISLEPDVLKRNKSPLKSVLEFINEHYGKNAGHPTLKFEDTQAAAWEAVCAKCQALSDGKMLEKTGTGLENVLGYIDELYQMAHAEHGTPQQSMSQVNVWAEKARKYDEFVDRVAEQYPGILGAIDKTAFILEGMDSACDVTNPTAFLAAPNGELIPLFAPRIFNIEMTKRTEGEG